MTDTRPAPEPPQLPALERLGVAYIKRMSRRHPHRQDAAIHLFDPWERAALKRVERGAIIRAMAAGALSALVAAGGVWVANTYLPVASNAAAWTDHLAHWGAVFGIAGIAALFEIGFLYVDALRSVLLLARAAGLPLFDEEDDSVDAELGRALARAALELPNSAEPICGVNPLREASRWRLLLHSLLYKGKIAVTNFVLKAVVRRAFGRAAVRGAVIELVAVPITAVWNGVVTWLIMREARLRIVGPSAGSELMGALFQSPAAPSSPQRAGAVRAVAAAIVRSRDLHPNLVALLRESMRRAALDDASGLDDTQAFLSQVDTADPKQARWLMAVATLAAISDGRFTAAERRLLVALRQACGFSEDLAQVDRLASRLRRGDRITADDLLDAASAGLLDAALANR